MTASEVQVVSEELKERLDLAYDDEVITKQFPNVCLPYAMRRTSDEIVREQDVQTDLNLIPWEAQYVSDRLASTEVVERFDTVRLGYKQVAAHGCPFFRSATNSKGKKIGLCMLHSSQSKADLRPLDCRSSPIRLESTGFGSANLYKHRTSWLSTHPMTQKLFQAAVNYATSAWVAVWAYIPDWWWLTVLNRTPIGREYAPLGSITFELYVTPIRVANELEVGADSAVITTALARLYATNSCKTCNGKGFINQTACPACVAPVYAWNRRREEELGVPTKDGFAIKSVKLD